MLTADQISALRDRSEQLLDPVINFLIEDIARRVKEAGQLTGTASYQTWRLQNLGMSQRQLKKEIAKRLEISLADAEKLLTQAAETGYNFDLSRFPNTQAIPLSANSSLQQILAATVAQAREDLTNMTQTMGFVGADGICRPLTKAYQQACDFAFQKISTGAQDYVSAIRDATWGLAEKGIRTIDYKSGYHISIEAAVRQNMMGGMGIMQNHIAQNNHDTLGCNGWEISAHENSAPDHEPIQGKQYSDAEYEALNNSLARRIGTLHCGHYASPIILGVHSPQYTDEELEDMRRRNEEGVTFDGRHYTGFEATQRQRKFERTIRKQQRRILIDETVEDTAKLQTDQIRLQRLKQEYKRFSDGVGLPMQYERLDTAGFSWKHAKAAQKAAKSGGSAIQTADVAASTVTGNHSYLQKAETSKNRRIAKERTEVPKERIAMETEWDENYGVRSWKNAQKKRLTSAEYEAIKEPVEYGILYDGNGKRIFRKKGDGTSVDFTPSEIRQMRGGVLTHNHPGIDYGCFSPADIEMLRESHLSEIRVTTPVGVFSMQRPKRWPSGINSLDKIKKAYYDIDKTVGNEYMAKVFSGELSFVDADNLEQRAVIEEFCKQHKIPFRFDSWEDLGKVSYENILRSDT